MYGVFTAGAAARILVFGIEAALEAAPPQSRAPTPVSWFLHSPGLGHGQISLLVVRAGHSCAAGRLASEGIADKELSELLAREQLIPVVHGTTYEALREVSPRHRRQDRRAGRRVGRVRAEM